MCKENAAIAAAWQEESVPLAYAEAVLPEPIPQPVETIGPPDTRLTTHTVQASRKGESVLHVVSTKGMKVGQKLRVGKSVFEEVMIKAFGSIFTVDPLLLDHEAGEEVVVVEASRAIPLIHIISNDDDGVDQSDVNSTKSSPALEIRTSSGKGKPTLPSRPMSQHEIPLFHLVTIEAVLQVSGRTDDKEKEFLEEMLTWDVDDPRLDEVPTKMVPMDRNLKPGLLKLCKGDNRLNDAIERKRAEYLIVKKLISCRKILAMLYNSLATDTRFLEVMTIKNLANMRWEDYGDANADKFLDDFLKIVARIPKGLDERHQQSMLYSEMIKSEGLKLPLVKYEDSQEVDKTLKLLLDIYNTWLNKKKHVENNNKERARVDGKTPKGGKLNALGTSGKDKGKPPSPCNNCGGDHWRNDCPKAAGGDGGGGGGGKTGKKGKGKGKGKGTAGGGNGTPRFDPSKTKCSYHQVKWHKGDGCMKSGEACKFVHDLCTSQAEYDALYKPWEHTDRSNRNTPRTDRSDRSNRDKPESPRPAAPKAGGKPKVFLACADFNAFCRLGNACPKRQVGGTGECRKIHCETEEADQHIDNWKIKIAAVKPAPKKKGTPRGEAGE